MAEGRDTVSHGSRGSVARARPQPASALGSTSGAGAGRGAGAQERPAGCTPGQAGVPALQCEASTRLRGLSGKEWFLNNQFCFNYSLFLSFRPHKPFPFGVDKKNVCKTCHNTGLKTQNYAQVAMKNPLIPLHVRRKRQTCCPALWSQVPLMDTEEMSGFLEYVRQRGFQIYCNMEVIVRVMKRFPKETFFYTSVLLET